ncbi:MAG: TIM barrel protein [Erysipelotrichaceae bacterium]|nr:TIM barrel protein [Erysipelotrichaceae bacterium]
MNKSYRIGAYEKAFPEGFNIAYMLEMARNAGYDFFELSIDRTEKRIGRLYSDEYIDNLKKAMDEKKIRVESICLSALSTYTLGNSDPEKEKRAVEIFRKTMDFACRLDIPVIQIPACDMPKFDPRDGQTDRRFRDNLKMLLKEAQQKGLTIGLENMENDYMDTIAKSIDLLREMNCACFRLYSDSGNTYNGNRLAGSDYLEDLEKGRGYYHAFHLKEVNEVRYGGLFYGKGHCDFAGMVRKVWSMGVRQFVLEYWYTGSPNWLKDLAEARRMCEEWIRGAMENV